MPHNIKDPQFYLGVVEDRMDPLMLGRVRVRVLGLHTYDKTLLPTEDLPWAYKVQPTTSGAITGIGHAPVGVMEGTWVLIQYIDPDKQMPFIVGSVGGIPQSKIPPLESFELLNGENNVVSSSANQGTPSTQQAPATAQQAQDALTTKTASQLTISQSTIANLKKSEAFKSCPYDDGVGVWTVGYGSTYLKSGAKVTKDTPCISESEADELLRYKISTEFEAAVKRNVRVTLTQSMYDSLVHMAYNVGIGGIATFIKESGLNSGNYQQAAEYMSDFRVRPGSSVEKGLRSRRSYERSLFLQDGVPSKDGTQVENTPQSLDKKEQEYRTANPAASDQQVRDAVYKITPFTGPQGFKDPSEKYPLKTHLDEPDTNRLARHQKIRDTIVYLKETARHLAVSKANQKGTWDQSPIPYNAKYPFNNVWQSESGHFQEFDDTPGRERTHSYHRSGTFTEVDHNGTQVNRIVGDGYQIYERNGFVYIVGNLDVTVDGATTLLIKNTLDVQVDGKTTINLHGDADLNVANNLNITTAGNVKWNVGGNFAVDARRIDLNSGVARGLSFVSYNGGEATSPAPLSVNVRGDEVADKYEFDSEEDQPAVREAYQKKMIEDGTATKEEMDKKPEVKDQVKPPDNGIQQKTVDCNVPGTQTSFTGSEQLSKYFKLSDLTANYSRKLNNNANTTPVQKFCNLKALAENCLDPIKAKWSNMQINSGFRDFVPPGGATTSQHMTGQAVDISFPGLSREALYDRIVEIQKMIPYDQLILEYASGPGWIHISFNTAGNRKQQFTMNHHKRVSKDMYTIVKIS